MENRAVCVSLKAHTRESIVTGEREGEGGREREREGEGGRGREGGRREEGTAREWCKKTPMVKAS